jgi:signal recognition particle subunit SRP72
MSGANAPSLQSLLTLLKQTSLEDHDQVLKAANNALKGAKDKTDVLHIKLVALIKLDRFDDALRVFSAGGDKLKDRARLEYAYALYKAGRLSEAEDVAAGPQGSLGIRHVLAQAVGSS